MSKKEKLLSKLKAKPTDFTFNDLKTLLNYFDYQLSTRRRTSGSAVMFYHKTHPPIRLHQPHPNNELKPYQIRQILNLLEQEGLI